MHFNPPAPCGAGPPVSAGAVGLFNFNPPAPCGAGPAVMTPSLVSCYFNPPAPCGAGHAPAPRPWLPMNFNPPAPCGAGRTRRPLLRYLQTFQSPRPLRGGTAILHKKTVQNIAYCTKSAFILAVLSGFLALMRPFFLPNVHKFRCEPSEESLLAPRSHAYTIRTPSG